MDLSSTQAAFVQGNEWLVIAVVLLVLFGGSQLPKLARSLGQAQKELKKGMDEGMSDDDSDSGGSSSSDTTSDKA